MTRRNKSRTLSAIARSAEVYRMLLDGHETHEIYEAMHEKYKACSRTVDAYIARARVRLEAYLEKNEPQRLELALAQLQDLYLKAMQAGDRREALAVRKEMNELQGLYPEKKTLHAGHDGGPLRVIVEYVDEVKQ